MESPPSARAAFSVCFLVFVTTGVEGRLKIGTVGRSSSCGGYSTPWKCPYIAYENGQGCFEVAITTASECLAAAKGLGYSVRTIEEVYEDRGPSGCYLGEESDNWSNVLFNSHPTGIKHSKFRSICHNRVPVDGQIGMGRDIDIVAGNGKGYKGVIRNVRYGSECCRKCWRKYPGTQIYGYNSSFKKCTCSYKNPGQTLATKSVYNRQSTGLCALEADGLLTSNYANCIDLNKDYPGNDMSLYSGTVDVTENHLACQALCKATMGCNFFTWSSTNKRCYLKREKSSVNYEFGAISGPKHC